MQNINIPRTSANLSALDASLRAELGALLIGVSFDGENAIVHLDDAASKAQIAAATQIAQAHDPSILTEQQRAKMDREARLEALRGENAAELDLPAYDSASPDIRRLAEKIAWLELEIATLR